MRGPADAVGTLAPRELAVLDAVTSVPAPVNEPIRSYAPAAPSGPGLEERLKELAGDRIELTATIGGEQRLGGGEPIDVVQPHRHTTCWARCATPPRRMR